MKQQFCTLWNLKRLSINQTEKKISGQKTIEKQLDTTGLKLIGKTKN